MDFDHLADLNERGVWWVTRAKDNLRYRAVKNLSKAREGILKDQIVSLAGRKQHPPGRPHLNRKMSQSPSA